MKRPLTIMTGFRPALSAREGRMLGNRNPFDGPVFDTLQDATDYSMGVMADHLDRGLGLSWNGQLKILECWAVTKGGNRPFRLIGEFIESILTSQGKRIRSIHIEVGYRP